jgi:transcriptional regulator with XRE-family HTH domain
MGETSIPLGERKEINITLAIFRNAYEPYQMNKFSTLLRRKVEAQPSSKTDLAKALKLSRPSFHALLNGSSLPRASRLDHIFTELGLTQEERGQFKKAYDIAKAVPERGRKAFSSMLLNKMKSILAQNDLHATSPFNGEDAPDLYLEPGGLRVGLVTSVQAMGWDTALGMSLRVMDAHNLDRMLIVFKDGVDVGPFRMRLFAKHHVEVISIDGLKYWNPSAEVTDQKGKSGVGESCVAKGSVPEIDDDQINPRTREFYSSLT